MSLLLIFLLLLISHSFTEQASMKRLVSSGDRNHCQRWRRDEIEVASILLSRPDLISRNGCPHDFFPHWGAKLKRSAPSLSSRRKPPPTFLAEDRLPVDYSRDSLSRKTILDDRTPRIVCKLAGVSVKPPRPPLGYSIEEVPSIALRSASRIHPPSAHHSILCKIRQNIHANVEYMSPDSNSAMNSEENKGNHDITRNTDSRGRRVKEMRKSTRIRKVTWKVREGYMEGIQLGISPTDDRSVRATLARRKRIEIRRKKRPMNRWKGKAAPALMLVPAPH